VPSAWQLLKHCSVPQVCLQQVQDTNSQPVEVRRPEEGGGAEPRRPGEGGGCQIPLRNWQGLRILRCSGVCPIPANVRPASGQEVVNNTKLWCRSGRQTQIQPDRSLL
jgi:hypothetical protein